MKGVIFDLDQTLVDSKFLESLRDSRDWKKVYSLISQIKSYPLIDEIVYELNKNQVRIAIVSSAPATYCQKIVEYKNWPIYTLIGYHDTSKRKPNPDPILLALKRMSLQNLQVISLGDRDSDIIASKAAGVISGACAWGSENNTKLLDSNPDLIFNQTKDLFNYLLKEKMIKQTNFL